MWIVCITSVRHVLTVNGYGGRQTKENEKSWCFKGWETLDILFMYISTTGIHAFLQSAGWGLARLNWGNLLPAEYKKDADAAVPLSDLKASYTRTKDNDNSRHPRQSFIYNTSLTNMLIYIRSRGVSTVSSLFVWIGYF